MQQTIGDRIKERREQLGMTQAELAKKVGYTSKATVCNVEKAGNSFTQRTLDKFAKALDVSVSYLMGFRDLEGNDTGFLARNAKEVQLYEKIKQLTPEQLDTVEMMVDGFIAKMNR